MTMDTPNSSEFIRNEDLHSFAFISLLGMPVPSGSGMKAEELKQRIRARAKAATKGDTTSVVDQLLQERRREALSLAQASR